VEHGFQIEGLGMGKMKHREGVNSRGIYGLLGVHKTGAKCFPKYPDRKSASS
jgi:hypothetical protein